MINMTEGPLGTLDQGNGEKPIVKWAVWFWTMKGYHPTLQDALKAAAEIEMPPEMIRPVPVAITEDTSWEPVQK